MDNINLHNEKIRMFRMLLREFSVTLLCFAACITWTRSEEKTVLQITVDDRWTCRLRKGDNPCTVLQETCHRSSVNDTEEYEKCIEAVYPILTRQLASNWLQFSAKLVTEPSLFTRCIPVDGIADVDDTCGEAFTMRMTDDLLPILRNRSASRDRVSREFDAKRNEQRMTDAEQVHLYKKAILLEPNHPLIVSQFGITLLAVGRDDLARALFANAVSRGIWHDTMQRPVSYYIPGLASRPWYNPEEFPFTTVLREGYEDIKKELLRIYGGRLFSQEAENRNSYNLDGNWKTLVIKDLYAYTDIAKEHFPQTIQWLEKCDQVFLLVKFSAIDPGTHIRPHSGPSNERLRSHLTLVHSGGARFRVGDEWRTWEEGKVLIFDSSWEHEVIHDGTDRRVVMMLDIWHPDYLTSMGSS